MRAGMGGMRILVMGQKDGIGLIMSDYCRQPSNLLLPSAPLALAVFYGKRGQAADALREQKAANLKGTR